MKGREEGTKVRKQIFKRAAYPSKEEKERIEKKHGPRLGSLVTS